MRRNLEKLRNESEGVDVKYGSDALMLCDWVDTTFFVMVAGRGMAKSTVVQARRIVRCVTDMPGAPLAFCADTYTNLQNNIMPAVLNGLKLCGLIEGVHYVKGVIPPVEWQRKCSVIVERYEFVYTFWNGSVLFLGSMDRPSMLAGKSVAHLFIDEAKFTKDQKVSRVMPILRGDAITYGRSVYFGGVTITTDMPDITEGEYDWFFRYASEMDPQRIVAIVQAADERNRTLIKMQGATQPSRLTRLQKDLDYWDRALVKLRKNQTFFCNLSSLMNIDILTVDYLKRLYGGALEPHEFLKSVFGARPGVRRSARFYILFGDEHKYSDGTISGVAAFRSTELKYLDADRDLDGGMDFGNMQSLVIAQEDGSLYRVHKNLYVLPPESYRELADQFLEFFAGHRRKVLNLYYDRAGNNRQKQGLDEAGNIKKAIETDGNGRRTGWTVNLMSRKQGVIYQNEEYNFMLALMGGKEKRLPKLKVDIINCAEMVSSIEGAKSEVKWRGSLKLVAKVKKTEKLEARKLPKLSTNFSDAFKYLMMRSKWRAVLRPEGTDTSGAGSMVSRFIDRHTGKGS